MIDALSNRLAPVEGRAWCRLLLAGSLALAYLAGTSPGAIARADPLPVAFAEAGSPSGGRALSGTTTEQRSPDFARAWPAWRGPAGDAMVRDPGLQIEWPESGLEPIWKRSLGAGFSGVIVDRTRALTAFAQDHDEYCIALSVATGSELWRSRLGASMLVGRPGSGPRATPTVDEDRVYAVGSQGDLWCFDLVTGEPLWHVDLQAKLGARRPAYGFASSPVIFEDLVLYAAGGSATRL